MAKKAKPKPKPGKPKPTQPTVSFEEALEQLRQTVGQLENGNLTLSQSLESYEEGVASLKLCYQALNDAQQRIEMLVDLDEDGNLITRPFDNTASEELAEGSRRSNRQPTSINIEDDDFDEEVDSENESEEDSDQSEYDPDSLF